MPSRKIPHVLTPLTIFNEFVEKVYTEGDKYHAIIKKPVCKVCIKNKKRSGPTEKKFNKIKSTKKVRIEEPKEFDDELTRDGSEQKAEGPPAKKQKRGRSKKQKEEPKPEPEVVTTESESSQSDASTSESNSSGASTSGSDSE